MTVDFVRSRLPIPIPRRLWTGYPSRQVDIIRDRSAGSAMSARAETGCAAERVNRRSS
jgi:hypothetical protein